MDPRTFHLLEFYKILHILSAHAVSETGKQAALNLIKIALEWALKTDVKKIIWICPRIQVCLGIVHDLIQDEYLPNSKVEIFTGEYKKILYDGLDFENAPETAVKNYFSGDIVVTTIDQILNAIITHHKVDTLIPFLQSHIRHYTLFVALMQHS